MVLAMISQWIRHLVKKKNEDEEMYSNKGEEESEDKEMDEEINSDESNEAVSSILHPRHFSIFLCRHGRV